jgi:hypothetical protein
MLRPKLVSIDAEPDPQGATGVREAAGVALAVDAPLAMCATDALGLAGATLGVALAAAPGAALAATLPDGAVDGSCALDAKGSTATAVRSARSDASRRPAPKGARGAGARRGVDVMPP